MSVVGKCEHGNFPLMHELLGVIPRATNALFGKLAGSPALKRSERSGLCTPTRHFIRTGTSNFGKAQTQASDGKYW